MALIRTILSIPFKPAITGSLAVLLSYGPPSIREPLFELLGQYLSAESITRLITSLKVLAFLGLIKDINTKLNQVALNNWTWTSQAKKWKWPREVAVVTGGSSGIGLHIVKQLAAKGVKVAVFDIQPLPKDVEGRKSCPII
jgi:hypothetical protein